MATQNYELRDRIEIAETIDSDVMGKTRAGGQSADRFDRRRAEQLEDFFAKVVRELGRETDEEGGERLVVPTDFEAGARFQEGFGGIGALLRFPIE